MNRKNHIQKLMLAALLVLAVQVVFAAFTTTISGHSNNKNAANKYSISNISKLTYKPISLSSVKYSLQLKLKPVEIAPSQSGTIYNSNVQLSKGNTTYIFPYKVKVKVPKFKAPSPVNN